MNFPGFRPGPMAGKMQFAIDLLALLYIYAPTHTKREYILNIGLAEQGGSVSGTNWELKGRKEIIFTFFWSGMSGLEGKKL